MQKRPEINLRFESKGQLDRIRKAAKARKWSINTFVIDAADKAARLLTTDRSPEQLMVDSSRQPLNQ